VSGDSQLVEKLVEKEKQPNAVIEQTQRITITGIVGPYVFVRVAHGFFGCGGAHPFSGVAAYVWDAEHQKKVEFEAPADAKAAATADLKDRGTMDDVRFAEATPKFDAEGHLSIEWRFEKFTFYADSDGRGSAYTASAVAESVELPAQLRAYRDAPPSVLKYSAQTGEPILGWSRIVREPH